jgi:hypothetical protein
VTSLLPSRRVDARRAWALRTLRQHTDVDGHCAFCTSQYASSPEWPCLPARIAALYAGDPRRHAAPAATDPSRVG